MAGPGFGAIAGVDNYNVETSNGLGARTRIISLSKASMSQAELDSLASLITLGGVSGTDDAVSIAGITDFEAGVTGVVHVAVQGTGVLTPGVSYRGVTGVTMAVVADFDNPF